MDNAKLKIVVSLRDDLIIMSEGHTFLFNFQLSIFNLLQAQRSILEVRFIV